MYVDAFANPLLMAVMGAIACIIHDGMHWSLLEARIQAHEDIAYTHGGIAFQQVLKCHDVFF